MDHDDACNLQLPSRSKAACCGYSASVTELESKQIQDQAAHRLSQMPVDQRPAINLDHLTKPGLKNFMPGIVDDAMKVGQAYRFGVSASVWKGSSGDPCVLLEGPKGGAIIGTGKSFQS